MQSSSDLFGIPKRQEPARSEVWVNKLANVGSTNGTVYYYTAIVRIVGGDIIYQNQGQTIFGDRFLINTDGVYAVTAQDIYAQTILLTRNASGSDLTGTPGASSIGPDGVNVVLCNQPLSSSGGNSTVIVNCKAGDIIRSQTTATPALSTTLNQNQFLRITRIS